jgi:hypothetical protein
MPVSAAKTDFEQWLAAQFADTGAFTIFIVLVRIAGEQISAVRSTYAQMIGDDMKWQEMTALLDGARTPWDAVAFFVGLGAQGPMMDAVARTKLREIESSVLADPLALNRGMFFDRQGRHMRVDEAG